MTSRLQSLGTEVLTQEENLAGLAALNRELVARAEAIDSPRRIVLDMDSTEIPVYGFMGKGDFILDPEVLGQHLTEQLGRSEVYSDIGG